MNKKMIERWIKDDAEQDEERYLFLLDNRKMCEAVITVGYRPVYLASKSGDFFTAEEFKTFLEEHLYGFDLDQYVFIPCCFRKRTNDVIAEYCSINGLSVKTSGWSLFRDKEYLAKYEYQDELEGILRSYIKRFEGGEVLCEDLRPFHSFNQEGNPIGVIDIKVVDYIMDSVTMFVVEQEPYIYTNGVYTLDNNGLYIKSVIQTLIYPKLIKANTINRVYELLIIQKRLQREREELNAYPAWWVNFKNGFLDVKNRKMMRHDPKYLAINQIPHKYNPDAVPEHPEDTNIMRFLSVSVPDPEDQMMLFQYIGYCMTRDTGFQKMLMVTGEAGTGKSQIISLVQHIVGDKNSSGISIQDLALRFYPSELYGKLLNACADIKGGTLSDVANIKKATGEDILVYERKNKDPSYFRSYAKLLFSANEPPLNMDEKSNAYYRRLLILSMNRVMKEEEKDRELLVKLKRETEYVIYLACVALMKLYSDGKFAESKNSREQVNKLYRAADSVKAFLEDVMEPKEGSRIPRPNVYKLYEAYCNEEGRQGYGKTKFFSALEKKGYEIEKIGGTYYVLGIQQADEDFAPCEEENPFTQTKMDTKTMSVGQS